MYEHLHKTYRGSIYARDENGVSHGDESLVEIEMHYAMPSRDAAQLVIQRMNEWIEDCLQYGID